MSHSKKTKRGYSLYVENWNPAAKKFINTCALCGKQGYRPSIDAEGFADEKNGRVNFEHSAIRAELMSVFEPLPLDEFGRCETCKKTMDK